jgi:hypothetical protein
MTASRTESDDASRWTAPAFGGAFVAQPCNTPNSAQSRSIFRLAKQSSKKARQARASPSLTIGTNRRILDACRAMTSARGKA